MNKKPPRSEEEKARKYAAHKEKSRERQLEQSTAGRILPPFPPVADQGRRDSCAGRGGFKRFCETYLAAQFYLAWSTDHDLAIDRIETAVLSGGLFAVAMPRGSGKSALARAALLWGILYGYVRFGVILGANSAKAVQELDKIKTSSETNELLCADWPEVFRPVWALERVAQRQKGQLYEDPDGEIRHTRIEWLSDRLVYPTIPGSIASGAIISAAGLDSGSIRGQSHQLPDGQIVRPDFAFVDDPQTRESAFSDHQCDVREQLLSADMLGMAGPDRKLRAILACTVIREGDLATRMLDNDKHPDWRGVRTSFVRAWPTDTKLWDKYLELRADGLRAGDQGARATAFYASNRAAMDAGADVSWPERHDPDELSAIQHAYNAQMRMKKEAFAAEYQNQPIEHASVTNALTVAQVLTKTDGRERGTLPPWTTRLTAFIDVHDDLLFWTVCAWAENFAGAVVDYGTLPEQPGSLWTKAGATNVLAKEFSGMGVDGAIHAGLSRLIAALLSRDFRQAAALRRIDKVFIDMGYKGGVVAAAQLKSGGSTVMLSKGFGFRAARKSIAHYERRPGEVLGDHWWVPQVKKTSQFPHILIDANYWKDRVHEGFAAGAGDPGSITLWGTEATLHELFARHIAKSEYRVEVTGPYGTVGEWSLLPGAPDNHWLDCMVGCACAASFLGVKLPGQEAPTRPARKKYTQEDLRRR